MKQMAREKNKSTLSTGTFESGDKANNNTANFNNSYDLERSNYGDNEIRRASTIEVTSGQSFLLLKNQEFIIQLKSMKEHLSKTTHPIMQVITHFQSAFIE